MISGTLIGVLGAVVLVVLIVVWLIATYNGLVVLRNRVKNAWAQIDVQLQRRLDLIPNLVETVKGYAQHESSTLQKVVDARSAVLGASTSAEKMRADQTLTGALTSLFAVAEAYPDLKANANFQQLQLELSQTEDKISYMRQSYNDTVMTYNTRLEVFPVVLVAGLFGFTPEQAFEAEAESRQAPQVSFS